MSVRIRVNNLMRRVGSGPVDPAEIRRALRGIQETGEPPDDAHPRAAEVAKGMAEEVAAMARTMSGPPEVEATA